MSFDMSYDRDGRPLKQAQQKPEPIAEAPVVNAQPSHEDMPTMTANGGSDLSEMLGENPVEGLVEQEVPEQPQVQRVVPQQQTQQPQEEEVDNHFSRLRKKAIQAERERDELARRVAELEAQYARPQQNQRQVVQEDDHDHDHDEDFSVGADDLVEGKHLKQVDKKMRQMQQQLAAYQQQAQMNAVEARLKNQYPDFDKVVSKDNIETLRLAYPELAQTIDASQDLYPKAVTAYTLIKQFGIHREDTFVKDREIAQRNAAKPKPLSTISPQQGDSALSRANAFANGLTDDLKEQMRKEMYAAMKNR